MLTRRGQAFTTGEAAFLDQIPGNPEATAKIYVRIRLGDQFDELTAQLDTGAPWSILRTDLAEIAGLPTEGETSPPLRTHAGEITGKFVRWPITLLADEGEELRTEATFLIVDWTGGNFLGYTGLLERIRFALDPPANRFYFGSMDGEA